MKIGRWILVVVVAVVAFLLVRPYLQEAISSFKTEKPVPEPEVTRTEPEEVLSVEPVLPSVEETLPGTKEEPEKSSESPEKERVSRLYFVQVDEEGHILLKSVQRTVHYTDSPLADTLSALLEGPSPSELNKGYMSLVPTGTKILSVSVSGGTAYLSLNEQFRFNTLGVEGYKAQLKQIVYTATEFSTVQNVQFLIDGVKIENLAAEGIYIGKPMSREIF